MNLPFSFGVCLFASVLGLAPAQPGLAKDTPRQITTEGHAYVTSPRDKDAARRRAIADALVSAALAGGATLQGHTVMDRGRITVDLSLLRPAGRVLSHRVFSTQLQDGMWTASVLATVGPISKTICTGRRLSVSTPPPHIKVAPNAPAWAVPLAQDMPQTVMKILRSHPGVDLAVIAPSNTRQNMQAYTTLTQGRSSPLPGDHLLQQSVEIRQQGNSLRLILSLSLIGQDGGTVRWQFQRDTSVPAGGSIGFLAGQTPDKAANTLTRDLPPELGRFLDELACQAPQARLAWSNGALNVPLGQKHGITRSSLAFVDDPNGSFGLLEVQALTDRHTTLRPLDPTVSERSYDGLRVYFLETGS